MVDIKTISIVVLVVLGSVSFAQSQIVEDTNITLIDRGNSAYELQVIQSLVGDHTCILFDLDIVGGTAVLTFQDICLDEGSDWYLTEFCDVFNEQNICEDEFEFWGGLEKGTGIPVLGNEINVLTDQSFFLGVNTGDYSNFVGGFPRDQFGWAEFVVDSSGQLEMLDNAMAYDLGGILIGKNRAPIPEPATHLLLFAVALASQIRRKRPGG